MPPAPVPSFTAIWQTASYPAISPTKPAIKDSIHGKSVLITGGGGAIGAASALSFAAAGSSSIALVSRKPEGLKTAAQAITDHYPKVKVFTYSVDVLEKHQVDAAFVKFAGEVGGKIDIVVSGAGWGSMIGLIKDVDPEKWFGDLDVNIKGSFYVVQASLKHLAENGVLINITSGASLTPSPFISAYSVSKAAAARLFELVQIENPALRVVSVHPGVVDSAMNRENGVPSLDDVSLPADYLVWAASSEAEFLKGKYVFANWDVQELMAREEEIRQKKLLEIWLDGNPKLSEQTIDIQQLKDLQEKANVTAK